MRKKKEEIKDKYSRLDKDDVRRNIYDKEILEKHVTLEKSCLSEAEKKEIMDMLYKYKDAFSLRDEVGTCPNIEVEINVMDNSHFLLGHTMLEKKIRLF